MYYNLEAYKQKKLNRNIIILFPLSIIAAAFDSVSLSSYYNIRLYHFMQIPILILMVMNILTLKRSHSGHSTPTLYLLLCFVGFVLFSAYFSSPEGIAFIRCRQVIQRVLIAIIIFLFLKKFFIININDKIICEVLSWWGIICSLTIIGDFTGITNFGKLFHSTEVVRQAGILGDFNHGAAYLCIILPFSIYHFFDLQSSPKLSKKIISLFCFLTSIVGILLTASRMGLIILIITLFFTYIIEGFRLLKPKFFVYFIIIFVVLFSILRLEIFKDYIEFIQVHIKNIFNFFFKSGVEIGTTSLTYRRELFRGAWFMFLENPWVGIGLGNSYYEMPNYTFITRSWWVHNTFLEILAEVGIFGFVFFIFFMFKIGNNLYNLWKRSKNKLHFYIFISFINLSTSLLFLSNFNNRFLWMMFIPLSMYIEFSRYNTFGYKNNLIK